MKSNTLLEIDQLSLTIPTPAGDAVILDDISLSMKKGETTSFVGESGCGKSMTAMAIMGLLPEGLKVRGNIQLLGKDLLSLPEEELCHVRGKQIGMIFQEPMTALNPVMTIGQQIAEGMLLHGVASKHEATKKVRQLLERVGLPEPRFSPNLYPHQLSGGQRQRVVIAIALACEPELLIADEPTTALDVTVQAQILDLIMDVAEESGMGLIMITHDLGVVAETTEKAIVMYAGQVIEEGSTDDVFSQMTHPYTRALFSASPHFDGTPDSSEGDRSLQAIPGMVPEPTNRPSGCAFSTRCEYSTAECNKRPALSCLSAEYKVACHHPLQLPIKEVM
ncbi:Oligopeptide transport ATP-binding protein oppD [Vibrio nigripulchritudo SFn27]|uniref:ABC-type dipeptide transporter n=1 Tax=Vibrio nigripulchritudo TaxID=28173 RepID=U4KDZ8_9VIBR|nr:ABC transporter ATP-binding protein [Vibrio nigripulchritudo]CCN83814.1 Oligopeptide transport ATP-binding protein oppD [Vibrio nigripulchritudo BLFn1]CCN87178.1 Oligopeptide transport ATP-binding protein oppD [Vibrio nigripulchritudo SFn27]CCN94534.1 Oligopeptide transport ATP-binding protein oppD [Vibrio nigripulchritudo ENn2]CCO40900.1 Oligopeptide transport ATP-binding protein oppD [Vibrio nigripulchritudo SFn135]CCO54979.1 Oligopeptide transport ATP-binding protein oppD [Vibrio nigripu